MVFCYMRALRSLRSSSGTALTQRNNETSQGFYNKYFRKKCLHTLWNLDKNTLIYILSLTWEYMKSGNEFQLKLSVNTGSISGRISSM